MDPFGVMDFSGGGGRDGLSCGCPILGEGKVT